MNVSSTWLDRSLAATSVSRTLSHESGQYALAMAVGELYRISKNEDMHGHYRTGKFASVEVKETK